MPIGCLPSSSGWYNCCGRDFGGIHWANYALDCLLIVTHSYHHHHATINQSAEWILMWSSPYRPGRPSVVSLPLRLHGKGTVGVLWWLTWLLPFAQRVKKDSLGRESSCICSLPTSRRYVVTSSSYFEVAAADPEMCWPQVSMMYPGRCGSTFKQWSSIYRPRRWAATGRNGSLQAPGMTSSGVWTSTCFGVPSWKSVLSLPPASSVRLWRQGCPYW